MKQVFFLGYMLLGCLTYGWAYNNTCTVNKSESSQNFCAVFAGVYWPVWIPSTMSASLFAK